MEARLVQRLGSGRDYVTVARGNVDGNQAGKFLRSFVVQGRMVEVTDGWDHWRWHLRRLPNGRWAVNKTRVLPPVEQ